MTEDTSKLPRHVAIIMDGNGRWARERGLPRVAGHRAGVQSVRDVVEASIDLGISVLTLYAFSQDNWKRPKEEVSVLMELLDFFLDKEIQSLVRQGVQFRTLGRIEALPESVQKKLAEAVRQTRQNNRLIFNIALNYGSRTEILDAVKEIVEEAKHSSEALNGKLTEEYFSERLYTRGLPDPDLLIRTSGEMRLSNFLLWQLSYAEIYITKKYWPDFRKEDFVGAVREYEKRERRFGDISAGDLAG
jgi:undecaprenyl diphosphate synthase